MSRLIAVQAVVHHDDLGVDRIAAPGIRVIGRRFARGLWIVTGTGCR